MKGFELTPAFVTLIILATTNFCFANPKKGEKNSFLGKISEKQKETFFTRVSEDPIFDQAISKANEDNGRQITRDNLMEDSEAQALVAKALGEMYEENPGQFSRFLKADTKSGNKIDFTRGRFQKLNKKQSQSLEAFSSYLSKKLSEALYGGELAAGGGKKNEKIVDRMVFYELYESQLGKNIIAQFTNYCLDSVSPGVDYGITNFDSKDKAIKDKKVSYVIPLEDKNGSIIEKIRKENIRRLSVFDAENNSTGFKEAEGCIRAVSLIAKCDSDYRKSIATQTCRVYNDSAYDDYRPKAKAIIFKVEQLRNDLFAVEKTKARFEKLNEGQNSIGFSASSMGQKIYNGSKAEDGEKSIDDLTTIASGEYLQAKGENEEGKSTKSVAELAQLNSEAFEQNCQSEQDIGCERFGITAEDLKNLDEQQQEVLAKTSAYAGKIIKMDDKEFVEMVKETEGRTIASNDPNELEKIKNEYAQNMVQAKLNIIQENRKKLDQMVIQKPADDDNGGAASGDFAAKKAKTIKTIKEQPLEVAQKLHYSNIVMGYLEIGGGEEKQRNLANIQRELDNSYVDMKDQLGDFYGDNSLPTEDHNKGIQDNIGAGARSDANAKLTSETVNQQILEISDQDSGTDNNP